MSMDDQSNKMSVELQLKAPIIIIPQNSQSYNAVFADLGEVTLLTKFSKLNLQVSFVIFLTCFFGFR